MFIIHAIEDLGSYTLLMWRVFSCPDNWRMFRRQFLHEVNSLVIGSIPIVSLISLFIGAVCVLQIYLNLFSPLLPRYTLGLATREILILEFSSAIMSLILAGKVGSNIASEIGTMRITEQIDAMEIMGVNAAGYIILPKISAIVIFMPVIVIYSIALGLVGGVLLCFFTNDPTIETFTFGIQTDFRVGNIWYAIEKSMVFAFLMSSISAYCGYQVKGGALEVGRASTRAVVVSSLMILASDVVLTKILLSSGF